MWLYKCDPVCLYPSVIHPLKILAQTVNTRLLPCQMSEIRSPVCETVGMLAKNKVPLLVFLGALRIGDLGGIC